MNDRSTESRYGEFERSAWQRAAPSYATTFENIAGPFATDLLTLAGCGPGRKILDVACGSGFMTSLASAAGAEVIGIDFSDAMVSEARSRFPSLDFREGNAEALPFANGSFDCVLIGFGVHHFPLPAKAMQQVARVLRPGGKIAFSVWSGPDHLIQALPIAAIRAAGSAEASIPTAPGGDINTVEACRRLLGGHAFDAIHVSKVSKRVAVESASQLLRWLEQGTARSSALIRSQNPDHRPAIENDLASRMTGYASGGHYLLPAVAIVAVGTRTGSGHVGRSIGST